MPHSYPCYCGEAAQAPKHHHLILTVSVAGEGASARGKGGGGDTVHSVDAATYKATNAIIHLCPENSVDFFLPARACIIIQISFTRTREFRRHAPGRPREQEQEQALQPLHFPAACASLKNDRKPRSENGRPGSNQANYNQEQAALKIKKYINILGYLSD